MDVATFNQVEAGLWFCLGAVLALSTRRTQAALRKTVWVAAVAFLIFGISDLIEARTGAWWQPLWLLILKVVCIAILVGCFLRYRHLNRP